MIVADVWEDAREVFGVCSDSALYRRINDAIELLVNKGDWNPLFAYIDICASGRCVALPSDVETPIAATLDGNPAVARNELYRYHLNGPGEKYSAVTWEWENGGLVPTMRDLIVPTKLVAYVEQSADTGSALTVYGHDDAGRWVRTLQPDSSWIDGWQVPTIQGWALTDSTAPKFSRITGVRKAVTTGRVRLATIDWNPSTNEGALLGDYFPHETEPAYRRVRLSCEPAVVRFYVRRKTFRVSRQTDFIPLHHSFALRLGFQAVKSYVDRDTGLAMDFESQAVRLLTERESAITPPGGQAPQIDPGPSLVENLEDV